MFWVKEFRGRNFLREGECNDPHSTHRRIVEYLFLFHMKSYSYVTLETTIGVIPHVHDFCRFLNDRFAPS